MGADLLLQRAARHDEVVLDARQFVAYSKSNTDLFVLIVKVGLQNPYNLLTTSSLASTYGEARDSIQSNPINTVSKGESRLGHYVATARLKAIGLSPLILTRTIHFNSQQESK